MARFGTVRGRRTGGATAAIAAILALAALGAGTAAAATPIDLGPADGSGPGLAITPSGSAALSYTVGGALHYCRIDPGAGGCSATATLPGPLPAFNEDLGNLPLVEGSKVRVIETRRESGTGEGKFLWTGEPFGAGTTLGTTGAIPASVLDFGEAALAPVGTVNPTQTVIATIETGPSIAPVLSASGTTAGSGPGSLFNITDDFTSDSTVSVQGSMISAAWIDQSLDDGVYWRHYAGSSGTPASVQTESQWSAPVKIGEAAGGDEQVRMATGPNGLYVAYLSVSESAVVIQHYNGIGFDPPVAISPPGVFEFAISEDSGGLLHLAYRGNDGFHYRYAKDSSNVSFSNPQTLPESAYRDMRIATTAAGNGWLSWSDNESGHDFVLPLAPGEPAAPAPTNSGGSGGGGGGGATPPKGGGKAPKTVVFGAIGHGLVGTLTVPKDCVPGGQVFTAKVAVKRKGSKAHKASYTVKQVVFLLGSKKISTDKRKPFEVGFATKGLGAGKSLSVAARISVVLKLGHRRSTVTKTLKTAVRTCG
jgi:hypothetical protein